MFEATNEIIVLAVSVVVTWVVAWGVAERRTVRVLAASYETEAARARRRITHLERQLAEVRAPAPPQATGIPTVTDGAQPRQVAATA